MILDDVIVPLVCGAAGAMAVRLVLFAVETLRKPSASPSPAVSLGLAGAHPYRTIAEAGYRDHAELALQLADDAVRFDRARIVTIATAAKACAGNDGERKIAQAIIDAIDARPLPMPVPGTGAARKE